MPSEEFDDVSSSKDYFDPYNYLDNLSPVPGKESTLLGEESYPTFFNKNEENKLNNNYFSDTFHNSSISISQKNLDINPEIHTLQKIISPENRNKKKRGRKSKFDERPVSHTHNSDDNIIKKIKTAMMNYVYERLNKSLKFINRKFHKPIKFINENLKKDYNIRLMNMTIREIYEENFLQNIYDKKIRCSNINSSLIQRIFDNNKDIETIKILNTKYIDLLNELDTKEYICKRIEEKAKKSAKEIKEVKFYMNNVRRCLEDYELWFTEKRDRNYKSKKNKNDEEN